MSAPVPDFPPTPIAIDTALVRRRFGRAVATRAAFDAYDQAAVLQQEVARRMLERLDYIKLDPALVLDAGCGTGHALPGIATRFPKADLLAIDFALPMLERARAASGAAALPAWLRRWVFTSHARTVAADIGRLPLGDASLDCIWSNLALHWTTRGPNANDR